ncbi:MAG: hypothetical protein AAGF11_12690 [Myxococcota bacterium]
MADTSNTSRSDGPEDQHTEPPPEPTETTGRGPAAESPLPEIRRIADDLRGLLDQLMGEKHQLEALSAETTANLLVLLTALRPFHSPGRPCPVESSQIDEYVEDMIDPEFGLQPARRSIINAAQHILRGYDLLRASPLPADTAEAPDMTEADD